MSKRKLNDEETTNTTVQKEYVFCIMYDDAMAYRFINFYEPMCKNIKQKLVDNITKSDYDLDPDYDLNYEKLKSLIKTVVENKLWDNVITSDGSAEKMSHQIGDDVKVSYYPASQRYVEHYEEQGFAGKIIFIDQETDNMFFIQVSDDQANESICIRSLETNGCHFFGMCRGFDYCINKQDKKSTKKRKINPTPDK